MFGEIKFFITDKKKVGTVHKYIMNQKSNAIMNMVLNFPLNIISQVKAIILTIVLFFISHKKKRLSYLQSLFHLILHNHKKNNL
ncbi:MAG: hypothetical protein WC934_04780 [Acidithiobacillus sp.]|jgi:hypothetical protein|uniref:hypothetical protein n=1 Tax=Acidithiobacillus sp. TaxID=1872118 RepID=UPI00355E18F0